MLIPTIISIIVLIISFFLIIILSKKFCMNKSGKRENAILFSMVAAILGPAVSLVSTTYFVSSLNEQRKTNAIQNKQFIQDNYNREFELIFGEFKDFVSSLSIEIKYNGFSKEAVELKGLQVIDELSYYLKKGDLVRSLTDAPESFDSVLNDKNAWFVAKLGDLYCQDGKYYKINIRPETEKVYFELLDRKFRNIIKPMFNFLTNKDNINSEIHKRLFAAYLNKNIFEAYLSTRDKPQDFPDINLFTELYQYCE